MRMEFRTYRASAFRLLIAVLFAPLSISSVQAAGVERFKVIVEHDLRIARPSETIVIPFAEVRTRLPNVIFDQVVVKDRRGHVIPSQVTAFVHSHKGPQTFNELLFQYDFRAGERRAEFTVEASPSPLPPFPVKAFARYVPERFDDFAWENDVIAHRAYGPGLELPSAGKDQMTSSGLDIWSKRVSYPIVDRWYHKGHDGLHTDTGEGSDFYEVGMNRGAGGTGIWDGKKLAVSKNFRQWKILANGPIRAIFELAYEPWDAGDGVMVSEVKRFTVDAGHFLDRIDSTLTFASDRELRFAIGLSRHDTIAKVSAQSDEAKHRVQMWETYNDEQDGELGSAVMLASQAKFAGMAEVPPTPGVGRLARADLLLLASARNGEAVTYFVGGAWNKQGRIVNEKAWGQYLDEEQMRLASPVRVQFVDLR